MYLIKVRDLAITRLRHHEDGCPECTCEVATCDPTSNCPITDPDTTSLSDKELGEYESLLEDSLAELRAIRSARSGG